LSSNSRNASPDDDRDVRSMFDRKYLESWQLGDRDVVVRISRVVAGELRSQKPREDGKKTVRKPIVYFERCSVPFVCNRTNQKIISSVLGSTKVRDWIGQSIALYATECEVGGEMKPCIRVRPKRPAAGRHSDPPPAFNPAPAEEVATERDAVDVERAIAEMPVGNGGGNVL